KRLYEAFMAIDALQEKYKGLITPGLSDAGIMEAIASTDKEIRSIIDIAFESPIAEMAFGRLSAFAIAGGVPIWAGLLLAVMAECDEGFTAETTSINPKLQKMLGKYKKK
ncbi:MAG: hypothetical protein VB064_04830, partial [Oscillospiraceae bacterium]|nr:hypothetical protein [Oscillospiraceae bacterium]